MLTPLPSPRDRPPRTPAYRVPWTIDRLYGTHPLVRNSGSAPVDFVRVFTWSPANGGATEHWGQMLPGEVVEMCLCAGDADDTTVTLAWFRQADEKEYVWRFVV